MQFVHENKILKRASFSMKKFEKKTDSELTIVSLPFKLHGNIMFHTLLPFQKVGTLTLENSRLTEENKSRSFYTP